jgi:hypothetical protein
MNAERKKSLVQEIATLRADIKRGQKAYRVSVVKARRTERQARLVAERALDKTNAILWDITLLKARLKDLKDKRSGRKG